MEQECIELIPGANHYVVPMEMEMEKETIPSDFVDLNTYYYRLINGQMRLKGIALGPGWELKNFKTENLSCYKQRGEDTMARYNWNELWPKVLELQAQGKSVTDIATELGIDRKVLTSKIYREENKQTPTPAPDELGGTDPVQGNVESATEIIPELEYLKQTGKEEEYGCPFDEPAFNPNPPEDNDFTAEDDEPIPYTPVENPFDLNWFKIAVLEIFQEVARANQAPAYVSLAFMNAIIDTYPEKGE